eukprot:1195392-Prymnesium_polylepis.1
MDCSDVAVLKEVDRVGLGGLLEGDHGVALPAEAVWELAHAHHVIGKLANETLERQLTYEQLSGMLALLVKADLAESDGAGAIAALLADPTGAGWRVLGRHRTHGQALLGDHSLTCHLGCHGNRRGALAANLATGVSRKLATTVGGLAEPMAPWACGAATAMHYVE